MRLKGVSEKNEFEIMRQPGSQQLKNRDSGSLLWRGNRNAIVMILFNICSGRGRPGRHGQQPQGQYEHGYFFSLVSPLKIHPKYLPSRKEHEDNLSRLPSSPSFLTGVMIAKIWRGFNIFCVLAL